MPPTVLHKNRKIMRDKNNCRAEKNATRQSWWVFRLTIGYFLFLDHLTQFIMMQLYYKIVFSRYSDEMNTIHEGDIILVDRDFCDVVNFLTINKKLHVYCPLVNLILLKQIPQDLSRNVAG